MTQLITGDMEKLPGDQRILICDRERLDPAQTADHNVPTPYDFTIGISLPSKTPVHLESLLKKLNSVLRNAHRGQRIKMADQESEFHKLQERHRRLMELARIVFACACWCRRQDWCASRESWLARMDVLRAQLNAGVDSMRQANELGLNRIRQKSHKSSASFVIDWKSNFTEE